MQKYDQGFSLMELLVVTAIIGFITMIGIPGFNSTISRTKLTTTINEFVTSLTFARSEAVKRNQRVVVRKNENCVTKPDPAKCDWEDGWIIFTDIDAAGNTKGVLDDAGGNADCVAGNECILQVHEAVANNYTLRGNNDFTNYIAYLPNGISNMIGSFMLCDNTDGKNQLEVGKIKVVTVNSLSLGRARVNNVDSNNNGIPEDSNGADITTCTPP